MKPHLTLIVVQLLSGIVAFFIGGNANSKLWWIKWASWFNRAKPEFSQILQHVSSSGCLCIHLIAHSPWYTELESLENNSLPPIDVRTPLFPNFKLSTGCGDRLELPPTGPQCKYERYYHLIDLQDESSNRIQHTWSIINTTVWSFIAVLVVVSKSARKA